MRHTDLGMAGTLYLVSTPIGNLEDMTHRAVRILSQVDQIACEDTRQTRKLLDHYNIRNPTLSYHEHNESERTEELITRLEEGKDLALVSDAGTPLISDPGYPLVRRAAAAGIRIVPVPGPSAVLAALSASGLSSDQFHFAGFLPARRSPRRKTIERIGSIDATVITYEAPRRILETLADLEELLGDRPLVVARELTKVHEEFLRGSAAEIRQELAHRPAVKGEITLLIGKAPEAQSGEASSEEIRERVRTLIDQDTARMDAIKEVARDLGVPKRVVYRAMEE